MNNETKEKLTEMLYTIETVKGDRFMNLVSAITNLLQLIVSHNALMDSCNLSKKEYEIISEYAEKRFTESVANLGFFGNFTKDELQEAITVSMSLQRKAVFN